ncbi:hypothetical protein GCM10025876_15560 [Demequina litorisediminis]|uniref:Periplasmic binding protein domain-containing protein n=1 Tax=Demequina litorisediminis TaxID=1849022 RepID=A0ABQ6IBZ6_9MICO|nr:hypothetical protein GCM10025876_15560 [Demequina litorisediminis]
MDTLQPFIDSGVLTVPSGQTDFDQAAILRWQQETAQKRMEDILTSTYVGTDLTVNGVLSPYDGLSRGIITALQNNGYSGTTADGFPIVSGQDAEIASVKAHRRRRSVRDDLQGHPQGSPPRPSRPPRPTSRAPSPRRTTPRTTTTA